MLLGVTFLREAVQLPGVSLASDMSSDSVVNSYDVVSVGKYDTSSVAADTLKIAQGEKGFVSNFAYAVSKHRCWDRELDGLASRVAF